MHFGTNFTLSMLLPSPSLLPHSPIEMYLHMTTDKMLCLIFVISVRYDIDLIQNLEKSLIVQMELQIQYLINVFNASLQCYNYSNRFWKTNLTTNWDPRLMFIRFITETDVTCNKTVPTYKSCLLNITFIHLNGNGKCLCIALFFITRPLLRTDVCEGSQKLYNSEIFYVERRNRTSLDNNRGRIL